MANRRGSLVEYRYDALGRRVLVRTTRDGVCVTNSTDVDCTSGIERFVYAGDNVLWEMRGPGSASATPAELDQAIGTGQEYGAVGYTHAGGVDRPLAAYKLGVNGAVIAPHTNWRGEFSGGTYLQGSQNLRQSMMPRGPLRPLSGLLDRLTRELSFRGSAARNLPAHCALARPRNLLPDTPGHGKARWMRGGRGRDPMGSSAATCLTVTDSRFLSRRQTVCVRETGEAPPSK
jgi:hypothetical protein